MRRVGNVLVAAGAVIGVATVTAIATGYEIQLTPEMIQLLTYKAFGAAAIGLIIAGTWLGRGGTERHRDSRSNTEGAGDELPEGQAVPGLPGAPPLETDVRQRDGENVER
jgi:hypothetical protein